MRSALVVRIAEMEIVIYIYMSYQYHSSQSLFIENMVTYKPNIVQYEFGDEEINKPEPITHVNKPLGQLTKEPVPSHGAEREEM